MEHQAEKMVELRSGKKAQVRALKARELSGVGEHVARILMHIYSSRGSSVASIITSGSKVTFDALVSILEITTSLKKNAILDLEVSDLVKIVDAWVEVNHLEEIAPTFFSLRDQIKKISSAMPAKGPAQKQS